MTFNVKEKQKVNNCLPAPKKNPWYTKDTTFFCNRKNEMSASMFFFKIYFLRLLVTTGVVALGIAQRA